jgi:hypothetical protein
VGDEGEALAVSRFTFRQALPPNTVLAPDAEISFDQAVVNIEHARIVSVDIVDGIAFDITVEVDE